MTPRRLRLSDDTASFGPHAPAFCRGDAPGLTRKTMALGMHLTCLGLFGLLVVWPVARPIATGELAREFKPMLQELATRTPVEALASALSALLQQR
jgi:hypothetical protein